MTSGRPSAALNPEQCEAIWNNAVPSGDLLAKSAAAPFIVSFTQVDKDGSGDISKAGLRQGSCKEYRKLAHLGIGKGVGFGRRPFFVGTLRPGPSC